MILVKRVAKFRDLEDEIDYIEEQYADRNPNSSTLILDTAVEKREDVRRGGTRRDEPAVFIGRERCLHRIYSSRSAPRLVEKVSPETALKAA